MAQIAVVTDINGEVVAVVPTTEGPEECIIKSPYTLRVCNDEELIFLPISTGDGKSVVRCKIKLN